MTGKSTSKEAAPQNVFLHDAVVFCFLVGEQKSLTLLPRLMQSFPFEFLVQESLLEKQRKGVVLSKHKRFYSALLQDGYGLVQCDWPWSRTSSHFQIAGMILFCSAAKLSVAFPVI